MTAVPSADVWGLTYSSLPPYLTPNVSEDYMSDDCVYDLRLVNVSMYEYHYRKETWITITWREVLKMFAYAVIFLVSLTGNLLVIVVVYYNANMRSSTNQYLVNLSVADLMATLVCMWVHIVRHLSYPNYILPVIVCKLDGFVQAMSLLASVLTLTVISVGRFVAVIFPLHARTSPDRAHRVIAAVWVTAALLSCPSLFYRQLYSIKWSNFTSWHCDEIWPREGKFDPTKRQCVITYDAKKIFYTVLIIAVYFLPVGIMLISYSLVVWKLWVTQLPGEHHAPSRITATRSKKKVVKMVSVVLLVFVVCWTPLQSIILYSSNFLLGQELPDWFPVMEFAAYFIAYSNSALNPIIYYGFNVNFRQGLVSLLTCRHTSAGRMYHRRNRKGITGGTRETTVGCSGPEPAVLLEFSSLKRNRMVQKYSMTPSQSGRVVTTGSNKELLRSTISDLTSGLNCKNCPRGGQALDPQPADSVCSSLTTATIYANENHLHRGEVGLAACTGGQNGGHLSIHASSTSSGSSRVDKVCGCCAMHRRQKSIPAVAPEDEMYQFNNIQENMSNDTKEEML